MVKVSCLRPKNVELRSNGHELANHSDREMKILNLGDESDGGENIFLFIPYIE
ncbi:hypothetical protein HanRHA438_Chr15g0701921 [Helianthus annuus]|nr:hypothetical protein HanRHA438_Chr15g0701921 [Helianthus annuus]